MHTFMTESTFARLTAAQRRLARDFRARPELGGLAPSSVFVPWAGAKLAKQRGIYYVGIAVDAEGAAEDQSFRARSMATENFCGHGRHGRDHSPFWKFFDALTRALLGGAYHETLDRWGWSNLLKIAASEGSPGNWPTDLVEYQREACITALREEFAQLRQSLIFIASYHEYGILRRILPDEEHWGKEFEASGGFWWLQDPKTGNLYVHSYHPSHMQRRKFFRLAAEQTIELAKNKRPAFGA
jgi:hypothetical protein